MKLPYLYAFTAIAAVSLTLSSCKENCVEGSGKESSVSRKVGDFTKIDISGGFKVTLKQDSSGNVSITTDDNLLEYIKTEVSGGKLHIKSSEKNICAAGPIAITIGVKNIDDVEASGAVEIVTDGKLVAKDIGFSLSGATKLNLDMDAANVQTESSGATEINLKGQATSHTINLSGAGKVYALDFVVGTYNISNTGSSECNINVLNLLNVESTGASTVKYKGNPAKINNHETGASTVTKIE